MEIRKLISKFITQLCEKNYAQANSTLEQVVEAKTKEKVKKTMPSQKVKGWSEKDSAFGDKGKKGKFPKSAKTKKKSSKGNK
jgi:hypothetical protein